MFDKIEQLIADKIRPVLAEHNGDISLVSYEDGIVKVRMLGQCAGCPSAMITTEEVIKKELMDAFSEIKDVFVVQETSPELIEFARQLMGRNRK